MDNPNAARPNIFDFDRFLVENAHRLPKGLLSAGSRMLAYFGNTVAGSPALAAETVVCTTQPFVPNANYDIVFVVGYCNFTVGTSGVSAQAKIRRGIASTGTTIADTGAVFQTAAHLSQIFAIGIDTLSNVANQQYSLTLTIGSGAAISTVSSAAILAFCT